MHLPLAFSIHHFISSVGADAGFAAIIGLAILVLLYFAQARETTTLRDEAISASQRVEQLERRVAAMGTPPVAPPPGVATNQTGAGEQPSSTTVAPGARAAGVRPLGRPAGSAVVPEGAASGADRPVIPAAPAGVGAPALIDATRLIPVPTGQAGSQPATGPAAAGDNSGAQVPTAGGAQVPPADGQQGEAAPPEEPQRAQPAQPAGATALATPPPATAAAGAGTTEAEPPTAAAGAGSGQPPRVQAGPAQPQPVGANGAGEPTQATAAAGADGTQGLPPRLRLHPEGAGLSGPLSGGGRSRRTRWIPAAVGVLLLAAIVAVLLVVTSSGSSPRHAGGTSSTNAPSAASGSRSGFLPSSVTVAVLNGTDVSQLAHRVAQKLGHTGYRQGAVATAADQTHTSTIVAFMPGFRSDASHVAGSLRLPATAVQQADQSARAIACPPPAACRANVIVTVGSDLTNSA